jgi:hypothetical protein
VVGSSPGKRRRRFDVQKLRIGVDYSAERERVVASITFEFGFTAF